MTWVALHKIFFFESLSEPFVLPSWEIGLQTLSIEKEVKPIKWWTFMDTT